MDALFLFSFILSIDFVATQINQMQSCMSEMTPTITISFEEASQQDLLSNPSKYEADTGIYGIVNGTDPSTGIILTLLPTDPNQQSPINVTRQFSIAASAIRPSALIKLQQPLDRDGPSASKLDDLDVIEFIIKCQRIGSNVTVYHRVIVNVVDVNDNSPEILGEPLPININELTPVGVTVGELMSLVSVVDKDNGKNRDVVYNIAPASSISARMTNQQIKDGFEKFSITFPLRGTIAVKSALDFETTKGYTLSVTVTDQAADINKRRTSSTTLTCVITDGDDLGPVFDYPGCFRVDGACFNPTYTTVLSPRNAGVLSLQTVHTPDSDVIISAMDGDTLNAAIEFTVVETIPLGYQNKFSITPIKVVNGNRYEASVSQASPIDTTDIGDLKIIIKATEVTENRRTNRAVIDAKIEPSNGSCIIQQDKEACSNITPIVGGVLGSLLALITIVLLVVIIKQRNKDCLHKSKPGENPGYQNDAFAESRNSSRKYEDMGMRPPNNVYDELHQGQYEEPLQ